MDPVFRLATEADVAAEHQVFVRAEGGLLRGYGIPWPEPPLRWFDAIARHLLATDPARCHLAVVDGQVAGFSFAWVRDGVWFLAALFVDPDHHGQGIGGRLFDLAAAGAPARQVTITDAIQPVSNALYARHGLVPTTPVLKFTGAPSVDASAGLEAGAPGPGDLVELDRFGYGFERTADHAFWSRLSRCTVWRRAGRPVAYAYRSLTGSIGPLVGRDAAAAAEALSAELARTKQASVVIPGTARRLVEVALGAGLRLAPSQGNLLLSSEMPAPTSLAISDYFLY